MILLLWIAQLYLALAEPFDIRSAVSSDGLVHGNDRVIDRIFRESRDYDIMLIMTAEAAQYQCGFCQTLAPDLREVAKFYHDQHADDPKMFFLLADLDYSRQTFQGLGLSTAPNVFWYPAETDPAVYKKRLSAPHDQVAFTSTGPQVQTLVKVLARKGHSVVIVKPVRWDRVLNAVGTLAAAAVGTFIFWNKVKAVYQSKKLWLAFSLVLILLFISGHMFNVTRGTIFMGVNNGQPEYIQPGYGNQFGVETQILAVIYALLTFCTILLLTRVPALAPSRQLPAGVLLSAGVLLTFSILIGVFKIKNPGFPFTLIDVKLF